MTHTSKQQDSPNTYILERRSIFGIKANNNNLNSGNAREAL